MKKRMMKLKWILPATATFAVAASSAPAMADLTMVPHPASPAALGAGIDRRLPLQTKEECIEWDKKEWVDIIDEDRAVQATDLRSSFIENSEELYEKANFNAEITAKLAFGGGGSANASAKYDLLKEHKEFSDSLTYYMTAGYRFGRYRISGARLKAPYQELVAQGKSDEVVRRCGTHFVISEERYAKANVLVLVKHLNREGKRHLTMGFTAGAEWDANSVQSKATLERINEYKTRFGNVEVKWAADGGESKLASAMAGIGNDFSKVPEALEKYLRGIDAKTSVAASYRLVSLDYFGVKVPPVNADQEDFFRKAYFMLMRVEAVQARLDQELRSLRDYEDRLSAELSYYRGKKYDYARAYVMIEEKVNACLSDERACRVEVLAELEPKIRWLTDLMPYSRLQTVCWYSDGVLDTIAIRMDGRLAKIDGTDETSAYVSRFHFYRNDPEKPRAERIDRAVPHMNRSGDRFVATLDRIEMRDGHRRFSVAEIEAQFGRISETRYGVKLGTVDRQEQWYDLGKPNLSDCPIFE